MATEELTDVLKGLEAKFNSDLVGSYNYNEGEDTGYKVCGNCDITNDSMFVFGAGELEEAIKKGVSIESVAPYAKIRACSDHYSVLIEDLRSTRGFSVGGREPLMVKDGSLVFAPYAENDMDRLFVRDVKNLNSFPSKESELYDRVINAFKAAYKIPTNIDTVLGMIKGPVDGDKL